ncbi:MAG: hypothetical protein ABIK26_01500 [Candidatus Omnitrophota bacterium]|nr:hypothetical protein [Candidatus Omnitrophota bacterium]
MEEKKKLIVLVVLGVAAVFSLIYGIITPSTSRRKSHLKPGDTRLKPEGSFTGEAGIAKEILSSIRCHRRSEYNSWGRNPFTLFSAPVKRSIGFHLGGIIWDKQTPLAVINDDVVGIGDKVGTNTIVEIKQDIVILNDGIKDFELNLNQ